MSGNIISDGRARHFRVGTNFASEFEVGDSHGDDLWLEANTVGPDEEFLFNGRLFLPMHDAKAVIFDNFPKACPSGWEIRPSMRENGYDMVRREDKFVIFGFREERDVCDVVTNLYDKSGVRCAETTTNGLMVSSIRFRLGRGGIVYSPAPRHLSPNRI